TIDPLARPRQGRKLLDPSQDSSGLHQQFLSVDPSSLQNCRPSPGRADFDKDRSRLYRCPVRLSAVVPAITPGI
ncbi:hypothetical protein, partial [Novosphingobium sp. 32-60-15]|uniref:hypothetical protein n=1 Tax=Novosphingobium sp. 32-60-15 TaxID=1970410 RepID=UPI0025E472A2